MSRFGPDPTYTGLYDGPYGPGASVLGIMEDPLARFFFFFFLPATLWHKIAKETNAYHVQHIHERVRENQIMQRKSNPDNVA